jgi:aryl-alcohol dehydrogenase-like predicted oxidoreductase
VKYRRMGTTGVRLSIIGLGTLPFGTQTEEPEARRMVERCLEVGVNHFDCADVYGAGKAEEILGRCIADVRDDVVVATKVGFPVGPGVNDQGASALHLRNAVEASLGRLRTDRIDLLYLHRFDWRADLDDSLKALDRLVDAGKVLYIGVSNFAAWQVATALGRSALHGWSAVTAIQPMYNLVKRQAEVELLPLAESARLAVLPYGPLAGGLLTGKYGNDPEAVKGRLTADPMYRARYREQSAFTAAADFADLAAELAVHPATLAVAWCGSHPAVTAPLIGGRSLEQLEPSLAAAEFQIDDDLRHRISSLTLEPPPATDRSEEQATPPA